MRPLATTVTLLSTVLISGVGHADDEPLRIGVDVPYEPYQYKEADGTIQGFEVELVNAACERMARECEWVEQSWDGIIPGLQARKYDMIASAMNITDERSQHVLFSDPYYQVPSVWVGKQGADIDLEGELSERAIGVQQGTIQDEYVTQFYPEADLRRYGSTADVVNDMHAGRLDLVFTAFPLAQENFLSEDEFERQGELVTGPESIYGPGIGAAFRKRDDDLVEEFNEAMTELKEDGTFDSLYDSYFDE
ncbi:transporter substrate-binding domain-containing protein [Aidingimonas lacisalsi]|uniref:transporter substrate-binding domain-containing protein n=1 Tax=Aidingimonas lacisalsi TaxID=2604086 RepID=UPI0011D1D0D3|nr:transporter substrate-binding domain-containing protein [Aidingimonas lacisalsi]